MKLLISWTGWTHERLAETENGRWLVLCNTNGPAGVGGKPRLGTADQVQCRKCRRARESNDE